MNSPEDQAETAAAPVDPAQSHLGAVYRVHDRHDLADGASPRRTERRPLRHLLQPLAPAVDPPRAHDLTGAPVRWESVLSRARRAQLLGRHPRGGRARDAAVRPRRSATARSQPAAARWHVRVGDRHVRAGPAPDQERGRCGPRRRRVRLRTLSLRPHHAPRDAVGGLEPVGVLGASENAGIGQAEIRCADGRLRRSPAHVVGLLRTLPGRAARRGWRVAVAVGLARASPDRAAGACRGRAGAHGLRGDLLPPLQTASTRVGARSPGEVLEWSAGLRSYLAVSESNRFYASFPRGWDENSLFPGFVPPLLALAGLVLVRPRRTAIIYAAGLALAFDMSLGLNGVIYPWLYKYAGVFSGLRAPARASIFFLLFLGALAARGAAAVLGRLSPRVRPYARSGAGRPRAPRYWVAPLRLIAYPTQLSPLDQFLRHRPDGPIAHFPMPRAFQMPGPDPQYLYGSTFHWKPIVNGYSGYYPPSYLRRLRAVQSFPDARSVGHLLGEGVRYLVVHEAFYKHRSEPERDHPGAAEAEPGPGCASERRLRHGGRLRIAIAPVLSLGCAAIRLDQPNRFPEVIDERLWVDSRRVDDGNAWHVCGHRAGPAASRSTAGAAAAAGPRHSGAPAADDVLRHEHADRQRREPRRPRGR